MKFIKKFKDLRMKDLPMVGGKNASLGQMMHALARKNVSIPNGFAITAQAYWYYLKENNLVKPIDNALLKFEQNDQDKNVVKKVGALIRSLILNAEIPRDLAEEIVIAYKDLSDIDGKKEISVAVRSSATAEDLPDASFAGQQETYLNVCGESQLLKSYKKSLASLFTNRALVYRSEKKFDHRAVALSVGVQKMVKADRASAGVAFSIDPQTGFRNVILIESAYGLGESIVKGLIRPDEFYVFKPALKEKKIAIIKKKLGNKQLKIIYDSSGRGIKEVETSQKERLTFSLNDQRVTELAHATVQIEEYYSALYKRWSPMDIEWAIDSEDDRLYIVQARPETVHRATPEKKLILREYHLLEIDDETSKDFLAQGVSIGQKIACGTARVIESIDEADQIQEGDIIVTYMSDPDWLPTMKRAAAIVTEQGGRTCHAAIVSRELGIPAIVGVQDATKKIKSGEKITINCAQGQVGYIYKGEKKFSIKETIVENLCKVPVELMVNVADPSQAFRLSFLPVDGVGLARTEFIVSDTIMVHPLAIIYPERVKDTSILDAIDIAAAPYASKRDFFVQVLSQGIGMIAAAFYPRPVVVRFSDFKSNEYRGLLGGTYFEPHEENPTIGFRGAVRYYSEQYRDAFALECEAVIRAREGMGLNNIVIMVPFVRTLDEGKRVLKEMKKHGLESGKNNLRIFMMAEVPSNVILVKEFSDFFDGFSIGSNDLTQLILGVDRDSSRIAHLFNERNSAVQQMFLMLISGAKEKGRYTSICGQAPSDYPEVADKLIAGGIDSLSLNADAVIPFLYRYENNKF